MKTGNPESAADTETDLDLASSQQHVNVQTIEADVAEVLAAMVDERDRYTAIHMSRVAWLSVRIGRTLGFNESRLAGLRLGAQLHDVGKFAVRKDCLVKPGRLSHEEMADMKRHPQIGYDLVRRFSWSWPIPDMVMQHHERIDGSGYPNGLRGSEISREAKIIAVADVVDAMLSNRPYRPALPKQHVIDELMTWRGTHYDSAAVDACLDVLMSFESVADALGLAYNSESR
jgi:HD-GYP domain-containing protein (c-di-GMP phosphodiesterase class II)